MAVMRIHKNRGYTVMSNTHLRDSRLTLKTVGLLSIMLSLPDDWDYSVEGLAALVRDGRSAVSAAVRELEEYGYLRRTRATDSRGRFAGYEYDVYENPEGSDEVSPFAENPSTVFPLSENRTQLNTKELNTEELITESKKKKLPLLKRKAVDPDGGTFRVPDAVTGFSR